jgi:BirA family biotin operon repressor/biotin-[acetyl-CoA-carboxylase] ligase
LRPSAPELEHPARITGLGSLALAESLRSLGLAPQIKWPNDVLLNGHKVAGVLVESVWTGNILAASILGMGVNVLNGSTPPAELSSFPSTCIEVELGHPLDRIELLSGILSALLKWREKLGQEEFIKAWEGFLAFRGRQVQITTDSQFPLTGELLGLEPNGNLQVRTENGYIHQIQFGELHLRPSL